uniref:Uncharacterized protein n=1 Tax=Arundo donax TaxID=35708 RepID=A0A0A9E5N6_ARUDO
MWLLSPILLIGWINFMSRRTNFSTQVQSQATYVWEKYLACNTQTTFVWRKHFCVVLSDELTKDWKVIKHFSMTW